MKRIPIFVFITGFILFFFLIFYFLLWRENYVYLTVALICGIIWTIFFLLRKDLRRKMLIMGICTAPLIVFDTFFIPKYYNPWLYKVIPLFGNVFLESLITAFFFGGIFSSIGQVFTKKPLYKLSKLNPLIFLIVPAIFSLNFIVPLKINPLNWWIIANLITCAVLFFFMRKQMIKNMFLNAFYLLLFYIPLFYFMWFAFPSVPLSYSSYGLIGIKIFGAPIEELIWAFSTGLIAGPIYEITRDYLKKRK